MWHCQGVHLVSEFSWNSTCGLWRWQGPSRLEQNQFSGFFMPFLSCWFSHLQAHRDLAVPVELNQSQNATVIPSAGPLVAIYEVQLVLWRTGSFGGMCRRISQHEMWLITGSCGSELCCQSYLILHTEDLFLIIIWCSLLFSSIQSERVTIDFSRLSLIKWAYVGKICVIYEKRQSWEQYFFC